jgi:hypothetical protein
MQGFTGKTVKKPRSIMMWLCIELGGRSSLIRCDDRQDSLSYQQTVLTPALNFLRLRGPRARNHIIFQQDGASCHTSKSTKKWLKQKRVKLLQNWPAQSPDLNLVEHCWAFIARKLIGRSFSTNDQLELAVREAWAARPDDFIPRLYKSIPDRLAAVRKNRGGATKY